MVRNLWKLLAVNEFPKTRHVELVLVRGGEVRGRGGRGGSLTHVHTIARDSYRPLFPGPPLLHHGSPAKKIVGEGEERKWYEEGGEEITLNFRRESERPAWYIDLFFRVTSPSPSVSSMKRKLFCKWILDLHCWHPTIIFVTSKLNFEIKYASSINI
jgi:hypothetical protein